MTDADTVMRLQMSMLQLGADFALMPDWLLDEWQHTVAGRVHPCAHIEQHQAGMPLYLLLWPRVIVCAKCMTDEPDRWKPETYCQFCGTEGGTILAVLSGVTVLVFALCDEHRDQFPPGLPDGMSPMGAPLAVEIDDD